MAKKREEEKKEIKVEEKKDENVVKNPHIYTEEDVGK